MNLKKNRQLFLDLRSCLWGGKQQAEQAAEKVLIVIPSEARDLFFFSASKKQQIPRANPALRNDIARVFPQPVKRVLLGR